MTFVPDGLEKLGAALQASGYAFVTPTPLTQERVNRRADSAWAEDVRGVFGWSRPVRDGVLPPAVVSAAWDAGVLRPVEGGFRSVVRASTLDGALFFHSAFPTEAHDAVFFGPDTYRFGGAILDHLPHVSGAVRRAVDIGCGAGPGAVLIARACPSAEVLGADLNEAALTLTRVNAALAGVRVGACRSDILSGVEGLFDLIVANPPYLVDPAARAYRHGGGPLGAGLSLAMLDQGIGRLAPGGTLLLYTGIAIVNGADPFRDAAAERLSQFAGRWTYRELDPDVFGEELEAGPYVTAERIAAVVLTAHKPG